jgi:hypothetical protein
MEPDKCRNLEQNNKIVTSRERSEGGFQKRRQVQMFLMTLWALGWSPSRSDTSPGMSHLLYIFLVLGLNGDIEMW